MIGMFVLMILFMSLLKDNPELPGPDSTSNQTALEAAREKGYEAGYTTGYETGYKKGYETAQKDIGSSAFTGYGMLGFFIGLILSIAGFAALKKKELSDRYREIRKQYELKRAFKTIPSDLSPEIDAIAHQIARTYSNVLEQIRDGKGYTVSQYAQHWRPKLQELMKKALRLMELIQELETVQANVDEQQLAKTIKDLQQTVKSAENDDTTRNAAVKSLQRAKQTQQDLLKTRKNFENCKTSLQGITGVLESMHLKISNLKVNTKETEILDELSSDLETEMSALEEALNEFAG